MTRKKIRATARNMKNKLIDNTKTVFLLDHTRYFSVSSEDQITLEFLKGKPTPEIPGLAANARPTQFSKNLWTCAVEAALEYCRVVWDLFPKRKLVRFIVSDTKAHVVNTWDMSTQNAHHLQNGMSLLGVPLRIQEPNADLIHGLRGAINALADPTEKQQAAVVAGKKKVGNSGRVICITSTLNNESIQSLVDIFSTAFTQHNSSSRKTRDCLPIQSCHLVLLNVVPLHETTLVTSQVFGNLPPQVAAEVHTVSAPEISNKLTHLILGHYDLASTTVTNIPMKEEQNANSSANYDVEILHARAAHTIICGNDTLLPTSLKEGMEYETVTLRWCTPRGCSTSDLQPCLAQYRVTPVDVTSRPSACLINFLLNGRSVLLEMPRKMSGKMASHLLSARGGEIFIHSLQITRSCLEDPPAISELPGGRAADYHIKEYSQVIQAHQLLPLKAKSSLDVNLAWERDQLYSRTMYFPLVTSTTILCNLMKTIPWMPFFMHKIAGTENTPMEESQCLKHIYDLFTASSRGEPLLLPNMNSSRLKGSKMIDQYKLMFKEMDLFVRIHASHAFQWTLLDDIQKIRLAYGDAQNLKDISKQIEPDSPQSPEHNSDAPGTATPVKPPPKPPAKRRASSSISQKSLFEIITSTERNQPAKRMEFSGRLSTLQGQVAELYAQLLAKEKEPPAPNPLLPTDFS